MQTTDYIVLCWFSYCQNGFSNSRVSISSTWQRVHPSCWLSYRNGSNESLREVHRGVWWSVHFKRMWCHCSRLIKRIYFWTGDFDLFVDTLPRLNGLFFAFNQPNYARAMARYHDNHLTVGATHPGLIEELKTGGLTMRRTWKPFSATHVDLTVEQTVNRNSDSGKSGKSSFTNSISCRERWSVTWSVTVLKRKHHRSTWEEMWNFKERRCHQRFAASSN